MKKGLFEVSMEQEETMLLLIHCWNSDCQTFICDWRHTEQNRKEQSRAEQNGLQTWLLSIYKSSDTLKIDHHLLPWCMMHKQTNVLYMTQQTLRAKE